MSNIEKIYQEIERLREDIPCHYHPYACASVSEAYDNLLAFIDSLPEEKPSEDLEEADELKNLIMRVCGYKKDHDQSLEEAALWNYYGGGYVPKNQELRDAALKTKEVQSFIAGAEWQKKQMGEQARKELFKDDLTLADLVAFDEGYKIGRRLERQDMLRDAVDAKIYGYDDGSFELIASWLDMPNNSIYKFGDKVKIIIIKDND